MVARAPAHLRFPRISLLFPCYFSRNSRFCGAFSRWGLLFSLLKQELGLTWSTLPASPPAARKSTPHPSHGLPCDIQRHDVVTAMA